MVYIGIVLTLILMVLFHIDSNIVEMFSAYADYINKKEERENKR